MAQRPSPTSGARIELRRGLRSPLLDMELIRAFVAVAEAGGFTAAADGLHRTQAAISLQIKRLEEVAGASLIVRGPGQFRLTDKGEVLLDYARRLIALNQEALGSLDPARVAGKVRLGATEHYASVVLPSLIAAFCRDYPDVQIEVQSDTWAAMRAALGAEIDLLIGMSRDDETRGVVLRTDQVVWGTAFENSPHQRTPLPLALSAPGAMFRQLAISTLDAIGRDWRLAYLSKHTAALEAAVAAGLAVSVFNHTSIGNRLRILTPEDGFPSLPTVNITIEAASADPPPSIRRFRDFLIDHLRT
ncbi:MAG: LysR substrate-binding domain-containing protein [Pseudomonadota bacterium]